MKKAIMSVLTMWILVNVGLFSLIILSPEMEVHVSATTIIVDDDGTPGVDCNYTTIQEGIDAANPGDTVFVKNGTYYENILIDKTINLTGDNRYTTIIDGDWSGDVVSVKTNWVNITGFSVTNGEYGIYLFSSSYNNITGNDIYSNDWGGFDLYASCYNNIIGNNILSNTIGISLSDSSNNNTVTGNNVSNHSDVGIFLDSSSNNNIIGNNFSGDGVFIFGNQLSHFNSHNIPDNNIVNGKPLYYYMDCSGINIDGIPVGQLILANCTDIDVTRLKIENTDVGIEVAYSYNITIVNNNVYNNDGAGIFLYMSSNNDITGNNVLDNEENIYLRSSSNNRIMSNNVNSSSMIGIYLSLSSNNDITGNNISPDNAYGIDVILSSGNNITDNNISNNWCGIRLSSSSDNRIYHNNIIDNTNQAYDDSNNNNQWDNGYPYGGNFWSDYSGSDIYSGPNQDIPGGDGIGDTNYSIDSDSVDNYPLMYPIGNLTFLYEGWNLISIPFIQPDTNIDSVLSSINGSYDAVQLYNTSDSSDPWKHNHISKPSHLNDLNNIDHSIGFWIHITEPGGVLFEYFGTQPTSNQSITLHPGWNMVGYPSLTNRNRTAALNNLTFGLEVDAIWTFDAATQTWEEIKTGDYFEVGRGYWIHATQECVWEVPI